MRSMFKISGIIVSATLLILLLIGFLAPNKNYERLVQNIHKANVGGHELFIPKGYMSTSHSSAGGESGSIDTYYPGSAPILRGPSDLWKEDKWYKNVSILFYDLYRNGSRDFEKDAQNGLQGFESHFRATKIVGNQYGLIYQTQPDNIKNDLDELWIERDGDRLISFINCGKKISERTTPQCTHYFRDGWFSYQILYDKRLLPEWKMIQTNVLALMQSFRSEKAAQEFIRQQIPIAYKQQIGE